MTYNPEQNKQYINKVIDQSVIPSLTQYIKIPNLSRNYDPEWATNGLLQKAAKHIQDWVKALQIEGLKTQIIKQQGYTPLIYTEVQGTIKDHTILLYGHFDKQPHMTGWDEGKGPITPVIQNGKLYGRGGADDGYSTYSSLLAVKSLQVQGIPLPRIVMITQGDQQSGGHIDHYMQVLKQRIGNPEVIFCLDSGALDYEHFWNTNSLRGCVMAQLNIKVLNQGVHSGDASGIVPTPFRILNMLLARIQDNKTGQLVKQFQVNIPGDRYNDNYQLVQNLGQKAVNDFCFHGSTKPVSQNCLQLVLGRTWKSTLCVTGINGLPPAQTAGNVLLPYVSAKISIRIPPTLKPQAAIQSLKKILLANPPYGAEVTLTNIGSGAGWSLPSYQSWLKQALQKASIEAFGSKPLAFGQGGSIPLLGLLQDMWPKAQFIVTGVLGPQSNAHGPNQFLHIQYCKKVTQSIASILASASQNYTKK